MPEDQQLPFDEVRKP